MKRISGFICLLMTLLWGVNLIYANDIDKKKLVGTWSYEKTESNTTGKGISLKVFSEWLVSFNQNGTYSERSSIGDKKKPEVKGTYKLQGDVIIRSQNKVKMKILVLTDKELVITSSPKSKIFFSKK